MREEPFDDPKPDKPDPELHSEWIDIDAQLGQIACVGLAVIALIFFAYLIMELVRS